MKRLPAPLAFAFVSLLVVSVTGLMASCGARSPVNKAGEVESQDASTDATEDAIDDGQDDVIPWRPDLWRRDLWRHDAPPHGDLRPNKDVFIWPDAPPMDDIWPSSDLYPGGNGSPYGCAVDADCLHLRCCPTAWGVKICMAQCP
ncbi:MAG: hypothetical protein KAI47_10455 [Deltaproteobacteria bacterium]|nr:hypothetical protein [Deltaproteobacteria bacterium]